MGLAFKRICEGFEGSCFQKNLWRIRRSLLPKEFVKEFDGSCFQKNLLKDSMGLDSKRVCEDWSCAVFYRVTPNLFSFLVANSRPNLLKLSFLWWRRYRVFAKCLFFFDSAPFLGSLESECFIQTVNCSVSLRNLYIRCQYKVSGQNFINTPLKQSSHI